MTDTAVRGLITRRALEGDSLELIEQELIEGDQALDEEQRAALWLYARHPQDPQRAARMPNLRPVE